MRNLLLLLSLSLGAVTTAHDASGCSCRQSEEIGAWCDEHAFGKLAGVTIRSKLLFETLDAHGHDLDLTSFECATCRAAIESSGFCDEHRTGFVDGRAYFSRLTHDLAGGADDAETRARIESALELVRKADREAERCEHCAVAIVTDTICVACRIEYRDGVGRPWVPETLRSKSIREDN